MTRLASGNFGRHAVPVVVRLTACLVIGIHHPAGAQESSATSVFRTAAPSVVVVVSEIGGGKRVQGSGVAFGIEPMRGAWLATNYHVVSRAKRVSARFACRIYPATLLAIDPEIDLAVLLVEDLPATAASIRTTPALSVGEAVYAIGSPRGLELSLSNGIISQLRRHPSTYRLIQMTAPISRGSSGGGLFDAQGQFIGITTFFVQDAQNLNFAIPAGAIEDVRHAGIVSSLIAGLAQQPASNLGATLDRELTDWRKDLRSDAFARWLGLARDAQGRRRSAGISGFDLVSPPAHDDWRQVIELFRDYRTSAFYR